MIFLVLIASPSIAFLLANNLTSINNEKKNLKKIEYIKLNQNLIKIIRLKNFVLTHHLIFKVQGQKQNSKVNTTQTCICYKFERINT